MISQIARRFKQYRSLKRSVSELARMDDRMLVDIGVVRGDIQRAVRTGRV